MNIKLPNVNDHFHHSFSKFLSSSDLIQDSAHCRPCAGKYSRSIHQQASAKASRWKTRQQGFSNSRTKQDGIPFGTWWILEMPWHARHHPHHPLWTHAGGPPLWCPGAPRNGVSDGPSNALGNVPVTALSAAQFADWCRPAMSSRENQSQKPRLLLQLAKVVNSRSNIQTRVNKKKACQWFGLVTS